MPYPDHHPTVRSWWAKRMADSGGDDADHHDRLYFGSTPTVRDLKYLYESGFDAVLSLSTATAAGLQAGKVPTPTTAEAAAVAAEAGLLYHTLSAADFSSADGVNEVAAFLDFALANLGQASGNGPIYVHDAGSGADAAAAVQLFRAKRSLIPAGVAGSVTAKACEDAQNHGIAFPAGIVQALAREAGETVAAGTTYNTLSATEQSTADSAAAEYPWLKYLFNLGGVGVFDAGQIQKHHIEALKAANIVSIINMRQGYEGDAGWTGMEPVNLLNVRWGGPSKMIGDPATYVAPATGAGSILAPTRPASWACTFAAPLDGTAAYGPCADTDHNFEAANVLEWGAAGVGGGQDAQAEGVELEANGIKYFHLPVGSMQSPPVPFNPETFLLYAPQMIAAVNHAAANGGHVLFHCTIGYRTGAFPTALLGLLKGETDAELMRRMHSMGYDAEDAATDHVFEVGTNALFGGLRTLQFTGTVDDTTGAVTGAITAVARDYESCGVAAAAEIACKDANTCSVCEDVNFGDDCYSNTQEHCAEIDCCSACEAEIRAMWACEHGTICGDELSCSVAAHELPMICRADQDQDGVVDINDLLGVLGAFNIFMDASYCRY